MKRTTMKTLIIAGVLMTAVAGLPATARASSLYDALQELYNGSNSNTNTNSNTNSYLNGSSNSGYGGTGSFGGTATNRGNAYYAINQPQQQTVIIRDISGNNVTDVSGNTAAAQAAAAAAASLAAQNTIMDTYPIGPTVADISMSELFHENYGVYEERITDGYSVYTNVSNGSITDRPVIFDVPNGVTVSMTRDGNRVDFANRSAIEREGYYVLMLYIVGDETLDQAFSKQTVSRAKFRFRIQYEEGIAGFSANEENRAPEEEQLPQDFSAIIDQEIQESEGVPVEPPIEEVMPAEEQIIQDTTEEAKPVVVSRYSNGIETAWDDASGYYSNTLRTGTAFFTSAVDGAVTNDPVMVQTSDRITYELYRNGKAEENFTPGEYITESGSYALYPSEDSPAFAQAYGEEKPVLRFRIVDAAQPVRDLGILNAPAGTTITEVSVNGVPAEKNVFLSENTLNLDQDGEYTVAMSTEAGMKKLVVNVDKTAPRFTVTTKPNLATINYLSSDVSRVMVWRGDDLVNDGNVITTVSSAGRYTMTVFDQAGNSSTQSFVVNYKINAAAVIAILIVLGLLAGLGVFVYKVRSSVNVR
ncbi:MAG: hypothetical protein K6G16_08090 [Lachnospiraceae bacterium]|nr:hypothetical protein [Lachnospiraceae bacterium]